MNIVNACGLVVLLLFWITVSSSANEVYVADFAARLEALEKICKFTINVYWPFLYQSFVNKAL